MKAFITGITGQDGSFLAELLLDNGYQVRGLVRRSSTYNLDRIKHLLKNPNLELIYGDCTDQSSLYNSLNDFYPNEIYHLAAQSHVKTSFEAPVYTAQGDAIGTLNLLETIRSLNLMDTGVKYYFASTSELYGDVLVKPQNEETIFKPRSPYAIAKHYGHQISQNYSEAYGIDTYIGILFNHESTRRGAGFVTRKITLSVGRIANGSDEVLKLGNIDSLRDWGHAKEYVYGIKKMLEIGISGDYVLATGKQITVRDFCTHAFNIVGIEVIWNGDKLNEKGIDKKTGKILVEIDPYYYRPTEVSSLVGDFSKAKKYLNWSPEITVEKLIEEMTIHDKNIVNKST